MDNFKGFIDQAAGTLGVSPSDAGSAASGILSLIQGKVDAGDSAALMNAFPGAADFMKSGRKSSTGGGLMGGLTGAAGGLLGGKAGAALSVMGIFKNAGMDAGQAGSFLGLFMDFVTKNAGGDLVGRILDQIPELKNLVGNKG